MNIQAVIPTPIATPDIMTSIMTMRQGHPAGEKLFVDYAGDEGQLSSIR